jgi:tetratricopeptide (TPR) repeat protein
MTSARSGSFLLAAVAGLLSILWPLASVRADDNDALRNEALALNDVTGDTPIKGEIKALIDNPVHTKKLLALAVKMAKEKEQPFSYNGALILARAALILRDVPACQTFYFVCAEQARNLQSTQKLAQAYYGMLDLIDLLYLEKKYQVSVRTSQEFLEELERQGIPGEFKAKVVRRMIKAMSKEGKTEEATRVADKLIKSSEDNPNWRNTQLKAWLLNEKGQYDEAVKAYQRVLEQAEKEDEKEFDEEPKDLVVDNAREDIVKIYTKQGKIDDAYRVIDTMFKPKDWRNGFFKGFVQQETGHPDAAAKVYEDLIVKVGKDDSLEKDLREKTQARVRYILSGVYVDMDRLDKASEQLQMLLGAEPDSPVYNNDLGYIWADHDQKLDEAEKMIRKALDEDRKLRKKRGLDEDKENAAYLDSMGWVLFKQKKFAEAKKYLLEAVQDPDGQHIEIMDHLGDAYKALGEKKEAIDTWKRAVQVETTTLREKQRKAIVEKKLKENE